MKDERKAKCHPNRKYFCKDFCKSCYNLEYERRKRITDPEWYEQKKARTRANAKKNGPEWRFGRWLKRTYNIDITDYYEMLADQNGRCAVCFSGDPMHGRMFFCVDHNHTTGAIRGLLCDNCNLAAGKMKDDYKAILRLAEYIQKGHYVEP
jgi:hypothetical protein